MVAPSRSSLRAPKSIQFQTDSEISAKNTVSKSLDGLDFLSPLLILSSAFGKQEGQEGRSQQFTACCRKLLEFRSARVLSPKILKPESSQSNSENIGIYCQVWGISWYVDSMIRSCCVQGWVTKATFDWTPSDAKIRKTKYVAYRTAEDKYLIGKQYAAFKNSM